MPIHPRWKKVLSSMIKQYGKEKGTSVFYATMKKKGIDYTKAPADGEKESKYIPNISLKEDAGTFYIEGFISSPTEDFVGDRMLCQESIVEQINNNPWSKKGSLHHEREGSALTLAEEAQLVDGKAWIKAKVNSSHPDYDKTVKEVQEGFIDGFSLEFIPIEYDNNGIKIGKDTAEGRDIKDCHVLGYGLASRPISPDAQITNSYFKEFLEEENQVHDTKEIKNDVKMEEKIEVKESVIEQKQVETFNVKEEMDKIKAEMKSMIASQKPMVGGAQKIEVKEIVDYKESFKKDWKVQLKAANSLLNRYPEIYKRGAHYPEDYMFDTMKSWECNDNRIELKEGRTPVEFKALTKTTNDETTYYQAAAELNDIYDPVIYSMLNDTTTFYGLLNKTDFSGRQMIQFRATDTAGITAAGYTEGDTTWTATNQSLKKFEQDFAYYRATIEVTDQMIISSGGQGGIGDVFGMEVKRATTELLKTINTDILAGSSGTYTGSSSQYVLGLQFLTATTGTLYGKARASITKLQGNTDAMSSAELSFAQMRKMKRTVLVNGADARNLIYVTSYTQGDKYKALCQTMQRMTPTSSVAGFTGRPEIDGIPIFEDQHASAGDLFLIDMDVTKLAIQRSPSVIEFGRAGDTRKAAIVMYFNLYCTNPNHNYLSSGLATT